MIEIKELRDKLNNIVFNDEIESITSLVEVLINGDNVFENYPVMEFSEFDAKRVYNVLLDPKYVSFDIGKLKVKVCKFDTNKTPEPILFGYERYELLVDSVVFSVLIDSIFDSYCSAEQMWEVGVDFKLTDFFNRLQNLLFYILAAQFDDVSNILTDIPRRLEINIYAGYLARIIGSRIHEHLVQMMKDLKKEE